MQRVTPRGCAKEIEDHLRAIPSMNAPLCFCDRMEPTSIGFIGIRPRSWCGAQSCDKGVVVGGQEVTDRLWLSTDEVLHRRRYRSELTTFRCGLEGGVRPSHRFR